MNREAALHEGAFQLGALRGGHIHVEVDVARCAREVQAARTLEARAPQSQLTSADVARSSEPELPSRAEEVAFAR